MADSSAVREYYRTILPFYDLELADRADRAKPGDLSRILAKAGTPTPIEGDEVPPGWQATPPSDQAGA